MERKAYVGVNGVAYRCLVPVKEIKVIRAEGPIALCGKVQIAGRWSEATAMLLGNTYTCPESGAYDKHDFWITWENGATYSGRLDLVRNSWPQLQEQCLAHLRWVVRQAEGGSMFVTPESVEKAKEALDTLDMGQCVEVPDTTGWEIVRDYRSQPIAKAEGR